METLNKSELKRITGGTCFCFANMPNKNKSLSSQTAIFPSIDEPPEDLPKCGNECCKLYPLVKYYAFEKEEKSSDKPKIYHCPIPLEKYIHIYKKV